MLLRFSVPLNDLSEEERRNLNIVVGLINKYQFHKHFNLMRHIRVYDNSQDSEKDRVLGSWDSNTNTIWLRRCLLVGNSRDSVLLRLEVIFHEIAHSRGETRDCTRAFERVLGSMAAEVILAHADSELFEATELIQDQELAMERKTDLESALIQMYVPRTFENNIEYKCTCGKKLSVDYDQIGTDIPCQCGEIYEFTNEDFRRNPDA